MSDRRAVSAGHLGASSVAAANEPWRVAVGGNRVENMTVDQIAHAFHNGQLNVRTPLWPPGTTGWQALGNFEQFQISASGYGARVHGAAAHGNSGGGNTGYGNAGYANAGYEAGLSQFEEADDDPTRMWTGSSDELPGLEPPPPPPMQQRPSARTGTRQVSRPAPSHSVNALPPPPSIPARSAPVPAQPSAVPMRPAPSLASRTPALVPGKVPAQRRNRGNGLMLVAGLVGLVGLGSAVLAARGSWGAASVPPVSNELAGREASAPEGSAAEARTLPDTPAAEAAAPAPAAAASNAVAPNADAPSAAAPNADAPKTEGGEARLAKYDDTSAKASAFVAGEVKPAEKAEAPAEEQKPRTKREADVRSSKADKPEKAIKSARTRGGERAQKMSSRATPQRAAVETPEPQKPAPRVEKVEKAEKLDKPEKVEKAEATEAPAAPANSAVNEAAAVALANSATLAASCRPRGGPAGPGKARVIYSNDGEVQSVEILTAKFRDTLTGSCVRMVFRRAKIPAFKGEPPTFIKSFTIPEE
jgi:hypothetical protein